jgi:hypothetical protein
MNDHKNKHIRAAVDYAIQRGWTLKKAAARAHIWGTLYCPRHDRSGCWKTVYCTPRIPEAHARDIRRVVDGCAHGEE